MALIRYNVTEGSEDEVLAELDAYGADRAAQGKTDEAREFAAAMAALKAGEGAVRIGHTVYRVVE